MNDEEFIGLDKQDALEVCQSHGIACRIACENGQYNILTRDYKPDRLNFTLEKGKIISVTRG